MTINLSSEEEARFIAFFGEAADLAGEIALSYFRKVIPVDDKEDKSPVTEADRVIEKKLGELILKKFPKHGIIGEEFGKQNEDAEFVWVIDPIDGTKSFATGRPLFGTILGLMYQGLPLIGLIDQPYTKERWFGIRDRFALHNGKAIKVAAPRTLPNARLYTGSIDMFKGAKFENYLTLCKSAKWTQYSCDCYAYGLLSMGWVDVIMEQHLGLYDIAGVAPIILGAGGFISTWDGKEIDKSFSGEAVAASCQKLAEEALSIIKRP